MDVRPHEIGERDPDLHQIAERQRANEVRGQLDRVLGPRNHRIRLEHAGERIQADGIDSKFARQSRQRRPPTIIQPIKESQLETSFQRPSVEFGPQESIDAYVVEVSHCR